MKATTQRERLRKNNVALSTEHSESSDEELEQLTVPDNISPFETDDEVSGGGKASAVEKHIVSSKTKCWLFF